MYRRTRRGGVSEREVGARLGRPAALPRRGDHRPPEPPAVQVLRLLLQLGGPQRDDDVPADVTDPEPLGRLDAEIVEQHVPAGLDRRDPGRLVEEVGQRRLVQVDVVRADRHRHARAVCNIAPRCESEQGADPGNQRAGKPRRFVDEDPVLVVERA